MQNSLDKKSTETEDLNNQLKALKNRISNFESLLNKKTEDNEELEMEVKDFKKKLRYKEKEVSDKNNILTAKEQKRIQKVRRDYGRSYNFRKKRFF